MPGKTQVLRSVDELKQILVGPPRLYTGIDEMRYFPSRREFHMRLWRTADPGRGGHAKTVWWALGSLRRKRAYICFLDVVLESVVECRFVCRRRSARTLDESGVCLELIGVERRGTTLVLMMRPRLWVWLWVEEISAIATWLSDKQ